MLKQKDSETMNDFHKIPNVKKLEYFMIFRKIIDYEVCGTYDGVVNFFFAPGVPPKKIIPRLLTELWEHSQFIFVVIYF